MRINGDLIPGISGLANLGVNASALGNDFTEITPFGRFHVLSGVFHDPLYGTSGIFRFSQAAGRMQLSNDGGVTFVNIATGSAGVSSVGVLGDANITGDIDLASPASGFIAINDTADASPILFAVNTLGLSGLWSFPSNGFPSQMARCFAANFTAVSATSVITHNIGTTDVLVQVYDNSTPRNQIIPDNIEITSTTQVTITLNSPAAGRVVIIGCV